MSTYVDDAHWGLTPEAKDDFFAGFLAQGVHAAFDNMRLGFPPNRSMEMMYYNQTWLEELGFDGPPTTPEEFKEMACAGAEANGVFDLAAEVFRRILDEYRQGIVVLHAETLRADAHAHRVGFTPIVIDHDLHHVVPPLHSMTRPTIGIR